MERLISDIEDGLIDRVIVTRLDRISRRLQNTGNFFQILDEMGTAITITSQPEIRGDAQGRLLINLMATFAEFERDMTCSRMEEARLALKSHGRRVAGNRCIPRLLDWSYAVSNWLSVKQIFRNAVRFERPIDPVSNS